MTRTACINVAAVVLSLALSAWISLPSRATESATRVAAPTFTAGVAVVQVHGRAGLRDASGHFVPLAPYRRIASTSGVTDSLLLALAEPDRIVAFTRYSAEDSPFAYRFAGKPLLADLTNIEALLALKPDLVLVNSLGGRDRIERLREAGLLVFDLGEMRGMSTLLPNMLAIATLLGRPAAGQTLATRFSRRMRALAQAIPESQRPGAVYVSVHGDSIYGGSRGTSYHDVLIAAGLRDASASKYRDWPRYTPEALLALDPQIIVTHTGMARTLCAHPGLDALRACHAGGRVIEVNGTLLDDPGTTMLDAAESVFEALHAPVANEAQP